MSKAGYEEAVALRDKLEAAMTDAEKAWRDLGGNSGERGLTPDSVKFSPEGRAARAACDIAFRRLKAINGFVASNYRAEERAAREARRAVPA